MNINRKEVTHPEWFDDGVHPNAIGNKAIAEYINPRLQIEPSM